MITIKMYDNREMSVIKYDRDIFLISTTALLQS